MKSSLKTVLYGASASLLLLSAGAVAYTVSGPMTIPFSAATQKLSVAPHASHNYSGRITALTQTNLTITPRGHKSVPPQTLPLSAVSVRAGWYTLPNHVLQVGEIVSVHQGQSSSWVITLHPAGHGILESQNGAWDVKAHAKNLSITGAPMLEGLTHMQSGTHVVVYGVRTGNQIATQVIQVCPIVRTGVITQNSSNTLSVSTKKMGTLSYDYANAINKAQLTKAAVHSRVRAAINPVTHQILFARAIPHIAWGKIAQTLKHNVYGKLESASATSVTIKSPWGTDQIKIPARRVKVVWAKHPHSSLSQIPAGSTVMLHHAGRHWIVLVRPSHHA